MALVAEALSGGPEQFSPIVERDQVMVAIKQLSKTQRETTSHNPGKEEDP